MSNEEDHVNKCTSNEAGCGYTYYETYTLVCSIQIISKIVIIYEHLLNILQPYILQPT